MKEILSTPQLLSSTPSPHQQVSSQLPSEERKEDAYEEKLKRNYEDFMAIVERESKKEIPLPPQQKGTLIADLFRRPSSLEEDLNRVQSLKCVESITFSAFNPAPSARRMVGDLFYLVLRPIEGGEVGITCSVNGFFRNDSVEKQAFQPGPSQQRSPCFSYTLVGTIYQVSPGFGKNLEKYLNSILVTEPYFLTQLPLIAQNHSWLSVDTKPAHQADESALTPLYGLDPRGVRDWNEEFQVVKDFPKETFLQRIQRDRAV